MFSWRNLAVFGISGLSLLASTSFARNEPSRIIGDNDLQHIPASRANDPIIQAVGRLKKGCTVTHVGNGIAITAGHCFSRENFEGIQRNLPCSDVKNSVRWGVTYGTDGYLTSQCTEIIATELNSERDYAIFRVDNVPASSLELSSEAAAVGLKISIFSHPRMRPMEWSQWCTIEGIVGKSHNNQFYYACDTEGGSSGAAVLDQDYRIVGIHNYYTDNDNLDRNGATMVSVTPLAEILNQ